MTQLQGRSIKCKGQGFSPLVGPSLPPSAWFCTLFPCEEGAPLWPLSWPAPCPFCPRCPWRLWRLFCSWLFSAPWWHHPSARTTSHLPPVLLRALSPICQSWELPGLFVLQSSLPLPPVPQAKLDPFPPSRGAACRPTLGGAPARGRFFASGLSARGRLRWRQQRGRLCSAQRRPRSVGWKADTPRCPVCCPRGQTPGHPGSWLPLAHGGRESLLRRRRRLCWIGRAGWMGAASRPAGATSTGSCAA